MRLLVFFFLLLHDRTDWSQIRLEFRISCVTGNMRLHFLVCASGENNGIFYFNWNQLHYWKHMAARLVILCQVQKLYTLVLHTVLQPMSHPLHKCQKFLTILWSTVFDSFECHSTILIRQMVLKSRVK